jgi:hypothetical protein
MIQPKNETGKNENNSQSHGTQAASKPAQSESGQTAQNPRAVPNSPAPAQSVMPEARNASQATVSPVKAATDKK